MAEELQTELDGAASATRQYATFFVQDLFFGVEVLKVQEVLRYQEMTPVPGADNVIEGLINLRGQIVTAFDMRQRLRLPARGEDKAPMNVVVRSEDGAVSLLVDEIGDVIDVSDAYFEPLPETVDSIARQVLEGIYKLDERLLLVVSCDRLLRIAKDD